MRLFRSTIVPLILVASACEETPAPPGPVSRYTTKQILVGRTLEQPQLYSYSARTNDNLIVIVINKKDPAAPDTDREDMYVEKYSADGSRLWSKRFTSTYGIRAASIFEASNGDLLVAANRQKSLAFGHDEVVVIRLTADGKQIWKQSFESDHRQSPQQIVELSTGEVLVDIQTFDQGNYILKLDANGSETGRIDRSGLGCADGFRFGLAPDGDYTVGAPNPAKVSKDGIIDFCEPLYQPSCTGPVFASARLKVLDSDHYIMLGASTIAVDVDEFCNRIDRSDLFVTQLDANGVAMSTQTIDLAFDDYPEDIDVTAENEIIIVSEGADSDDGPEADIFLTRLRPNLTVEWSELLDFSDSDINQALGVHALENQTYALLINTRNAGLNTHEIKLIIFTKN